MESSSFLNNQLNTLVFIIGLLFTFILIVFYYKKSKSRQLLSYVPNIWTSLGILGTFVAIICSLGEGKGKDFSKINELVDNIIPAFETSIIGIIGAIITSIVIKIIFAIEEKKDEDLYKNEVDKNITPELLLNRIYLSVDASNSLIEKLVSTVQCQHKEIMNEMVTQKGTLKDFLDEFIIQLRGFYSEIFDSTKEHVKELVDGYMHGIKDIIDSMHEEVTNHVDDLLSTHTQAIRDYIHAEDKKLKEISDEIIVTLNADSAAIITTIKRVEEAEVDKLQNLIEKFNSDINVTTGSFITSLDYVKQQITRLVNGIPDELIDLKTSLTEALQQVIVEKYNLLLEENKAFSKELLGKVEDFEIKMSQRAEQDGLQWLNGIRNELQVMMNVLDRNIQENANLLGNLINEMSGDMTLVVSSLSNASDNYKSIVEQINRLLPPLEKGVSCVEKGTENVDKANEQMQKLLKTVEELSFKNQQLRYELTQWKRVHKPVEIHRENKTKECPNCHAENPIDANFCRECVCGFWDYEAFSKDEDHSNEKQNVAV